MLNSGRWCRPAGPRKGSRRTSLLSAVAAPTAVGFRGRALLVALSVTLFAAQASAAAQSGEITGTLDQPGYAVIALAPDREAAVALAESGSFSLTPPAQEVTLHLRAPDGTYAGPVVLQPARNFELQAAREDARQTKRAFKKVKSKVKRAKRGLVTAKRKKRRASGMKAKRKAQKNLKRATRKLKGAKRRKRKAKVQRKAANEALEAAEAEDATRPSRAITGLRAGAELGRVEIDQAKGYAKAAGLDERAWQTWVDTAHRARAQNGVPIGAGNVGFVASTPSPGTVAADPDLDGVPDALDVDDNGNLVLDNLDTSTAGAGTRSNGTDPCGPGRIYCQEINSSLPLFIEQTVNANAGSTNDQINAALATFGDLRIRIGAFTEQTPAGRGDHAELDCGDPDTGLAYCRQNGSTGTSRIGGVVGDAPDQPFPGPPGGQFDPDSDGFGTLGPCCGAGADDFFLAHGAQARPALDPGSAQIGSGDVLTQWVTTDGDPSQCPPLNPPTCRAFPATVQYVYATVPTLVSYDDGAGNSATVVYPTPTTESPPPRVAPGSETNGFPVSDSPADADTDVEIDLTFWRPQRKPIPDERCPEPNGPECSSEQWIDMGGLTYGATQGAAGVSCPQENFTEADPELGPPSVIGLRGGLTDSAPDRPANPGNTFTYTLNLTQCLAAQGLSYGVGEEREVNFMGTNGTDSDRSDQMVFFKHE